MDELANELGMELLDLRRKNWIERDEPFTTVAGPEQTPATTRRPRHQATILSVRRPAARAAGPP